MNRKTIGLCDVLFAFSIFGLAFFQLDDIALDPGVGWHLQTGKFLATQWSFLFTDPFLVATLPRAWVANQWLSDLLLWLSWSHLGWGAVYWSTVAIFSLAFLVVLPLTLHRLHLPKLSAGLISWVVWKLSLFHMIVRPVVLGFFFFSLLYLLIRPGIAYANKRFRKEYFLVPLLFGIWANMHPSFVMGLVLLGVSLGAALIERASREHSGGLATLCVAAFLATLISPYGVKIYEPIFALASSTFFMRLHGEWQSPNFHELPGQLFLCLFGALVVGWKGGEFRLQWFDLFAFIAFGYFGMFSIRWLPYCAFVLAYPVAEAVASVVKKYRYDPDGPFHRVASWESRSSGGVFGTLFALGVLGAGVVFQGTLPFFTGEYGPSQKEFPYKAMELLKTKAQSREMTVLSVPHWGGFIIWQGDGRIRPFIDDRNELLGEAFYREYYDRMKPGRGWQDYARKLGADLLLLPADSPLTYSCKKESWCVINFEDEVAVLMELLPSNPH